MQSLEYAEQGGERSTEPPHTTRRRCRTLSRSPQSGSPSSQNARIFDAEVAESIRKD